MARKNMQSFKKRKASILKKMRELSVLCDVQACAIVMDPEGETETWPENHSKVIATDTRRGRWVL